MLFLLNMLPTAINSNGSAIQIIALLVGETLCIVALFFNRKGWITTAGILLLSMEYIELTFTVITTHGGLTLSSLYHLDFTILPDILLLTFFSADMLILIVCINALQTWLLVAYTPHDQIVAQLLQTNPSQIFSHIYTLQIITAVVLYLWARSTEKAIRRANQAEEVAAFEKREKELRERELVQKDQLNAGIQQILQTHVAVANGDFTARAPLNQDHMLWQVAVALNNLIARLQRLSHAEQKFKQPTWKESELTTNEHVAFEKNKSTTQKVKIMPRRTYL
jgi:hypothetical protein